LQGDIGDQQEHFSRLIDMLSSSEDAVNSAFDMHVSHVSHRTNQVMKVQTLVTVLLVPATIIIALVSMYVQGVPVGWPWNYLLMLCLVAVISGMARLLFLSGWL
jgi:magnesium transporter